MPPEFVSFHWEENVFALAGMFVILLVLGIAVMAVKALIALAFLPIKIGFGILKLGLTLLVGVPLLILGVTIAAAAIPLVLVGLPILLLVLLILSLIAAPFVIALKAFF